MIDADVLSLISTCVFGLFGIYQWIRCRKLQEINKKNAWSLYRDISVVFGALQQMRGKIQQNDNVEYALGKVTSQAEDLMNNQIKQINFNEKITSKKIIEWIGSGKICDSSHGDVFNKFV
ncbi:MAG: hypothetical protein KKD07_06545 [Candidatus Omnitrophica bacterium]|nr:hypothetical protein [Candidatus Omnitrophota bacterium]MBU1996643.1 hypothetical protein [Candidatus Omnitrophota bacterium]MBU4334083.1 hypothetical protein [Candidatus Omnitrophota bacterium]